MALFPSIGLGEAIILELRQGPREMSTLIPSLKKQGWTVTKQGIYKALRRLRKEEMVFLHNGEASLNLRWINKLEHFVSLTQHSYRGAPSGAGHFLQLREGERITYSFRDAVTLDTFWNHVLYLLFEALPRADRWYAYASHCWFLLAHKQEELALYRFLNKRGVRVLYTVVHDLPLDRAINAEFDNDKRQYHRLGKSLFPSRRNHLGLVINVVDDFIIETQYSPTTVQALEQFYKKHLKASDAAIRELQDIVHQPGKVKLSILRSERKATMLRKQLDKGFYLPTLNAR